MCLTKIRHRKQYRYFSSSTDPFKKRGSGRFRDFGSKKKNTTRPPVQNDFLRVTMRDAYSRIIIVARYSSACVLYNYLIEAYVM